MSESPAVIELQGVTKKFGRFAAVRDVSLKVQPGEVVGFVGANGAGKTTTISMLMGFLNVSHGTAKLFGETVRPASAHRLHRRIGYVAGDMEMPAQLTGKQYLAFLRRQKKISDKGSYDELIKRFTPQLDKKIHALSRGNKQKLALVAAFAGDPELMILDEPTSGLDPVMQDAFLDLIRERQAAGTTVFMSSHFLQEVSDVCSRVVLMANGRVVEDMAVAELQAMGGKHITVKSGYRPTKPPKGSDNVETEFEDGLLTLSFLYKGDMAQLQRWLAGVKLLKDVEVSDHNLEAAFRSLYEQEEAS